MIKSGFFKIGIKFTMKRVLFFLLVFLNGCAQTPFVDARREAGSSHTVGESTPNRIAICYNPYSTNANEITKLAQEACQATNREAAYDGHNYWSCRVFWPHRIYFRCQERPEEQAEE